MYPVNSNNMNVCKKKAEKDHMTQHILIQIFLLFVILFNQQDNLKQRVLNTQQWSSAEF